MIIKCSLEITWSFGSMWSELRQHWSTFQWEWFLIEIHEYSSGMYTFYNVSYETDFHVAYLKSKMSTQLTIMNNTKLAKKLWALTFKYLTTGDMLISSVLDCLRFIIHYYLAFVWPQMIRYPFAMNNQTHMTFLKQRVLRKS